MCQYRVPYASLLMHTGWLIEMSHPPRLILGLIHYTLMY